MNQTPVPPRAGDLGLAHRIWFGCVVVFGLLFAVGIAPFHGNDEWPHWVRTWSVAQGHLRCDTVPRAALELSELFPFPPTADESGKLKYEHLRNALKFSGDSVRAPARSTACVYTPLGYVIQAAALRLAIPSHVARYEPGAMLKAYYATRVGSWLAMCALTWLFIVLIPSLRNLLLAFLSIPEVIQQSVVLNNDVFLFVCGFVLIWLLTRQPSRRTMLVICGVVAAMTLTKPVFFLLFGLVAPILAARRLPRRQLWRELAIVGAIAVATALVRSWWSWFVNFDAYAWYPPWDVSPPRQVAYLRAHPLHLFRVMWAQFKQTFGDNLMGGSWKGIFGAFGPSSLENTTLGYVTCVLSLVAAFYADVARGGIEAPVGGAAIAQHRRAWLLAALGVAAVIPAVGLAMYLLFTSVGADHVNGVQGRYYLVPLFLLFAIALRASVELVRHRGWRVRGPLAAEMIAAGCAVLSGWEAVKRIFGWFWAVY